MCIVLHMCDEVDGVVVVRCYHDEGAVELFLRVSSSMFICWYVKVHLHILVMWEWWICKGCALCTVQCTPMHIFLEENIEEYSSCRFSRRRSESSVEVRFIVSDDGFGNCVRRYSKSYNSIQTACTDELEHVTCRITT